MGNALPAMIPNNRNERLRSGIKAGKCISQLNRCVAGEIELSTQQIAAARILLNKVLPDLPAPAPDNFNGIKDISHANPMALLAAIEGDSERKE